MARKAFSPEEFEIKSWHINGGVTLFKAMGIELPSMEPLFNRPITERENFTLALSGKKPYWIPIDGYVFCDVNHFAPRFNPDNVAIHSIYDGEELYSYDGDTEEGLFGVEWVYVPVAGGCTVKPGNPKVPDINHWEDYVSFPNLDEWDWDGMVEKNREYLETSQLNELNVFTSFWERLMSLMDVDNAAMALIDDDQKEGVHRFFDRYADYMIDYIGRMKDRVDIQAIQISDDWGHQNGPFFSLDTIREMLLPYLKRLTSYVHSRGMFMELHCCGKCESLVPAFIEGGIDLWCPQDINDVLMLARKYKDEPIWFGIPDPKIPPNATEEEIVALAEECFQNYKDLHAVIGFKQPNPTFINHLYVRSRQTFVDE